MKSKTEYLEIVEAEHLSGHKLRLHFNDRTQRDVDFGPFLRKAQNPDLTKYRDIKKFKSFRIHHGDLMWGDYEMIFPIVDLYRGTI
jgi:hypothetical protein